MRASGFQAIFVIAATLLSSACASSDEAAAVDCEDVRFLDQPMSQQEIDALAPGQAACAMVEREGGVRLVPVTLGARYTAGSNDFVTFKDPEAQFGSGDSGSPILARDGRTIGALSGTFGGESVVVTPITAMLAIGGGTVASGPTAVANRLAWYATGLAFDGRERLRTAGIPVIELDSRNVASPSTANAAALSASLPLDPVGGLAPGRTMAAVPFDGPLVSIFAVGTVTLALDPDRVVAFGHPLMWSGALSSSIPVVPARLVQFIHDPIFGSFKLAVPEGAVAGGIVQDRSAGILVSRAAGVDVVELVVNANGITTTHRLYRAVDDVYASLVTGGIGGVVQAHFDVSAPGAHATTMEVTYVDDTTSSLDLGTLDWPWYGADAVWSGVSGEISRVRKIDVTIL